VHIEKLNIQSTLKIKLNSALENFNEAKKLSLNSNNNIRKNISTEIKEEPIISSTKIIRENTSTVRKENSIIYSDRRENKFSQFIKDFLFSEFETIRTN